jgi:hypothetical protein
LKPRTKREIAALSLTELLSELAAAKIEPVTAVQYEEDGPVVNGVPTLAGPAPWLESWQKQELLESGKTTLTREQQENRGTSLEAWRGQLHSHGQWAWISALGKTKIEKELRARGAEPTPFESRTCNRKELERKLYFAMAKDNEEEEGAV